jgi:beta-lactamase class A
MRFSKIIIYLFIFFIGATTGYMFREFSISASDMTLDYSAVRDSKFKYTHPLLDVLLAANAPQNMGLRPFKRRVDKFIHEDIDRKWADTIAVYFRDLHNGPWFCIGEVNDFYPASLLKVPLMMAVLKQAETKPEILNKKIYFIRTHTMAAPNRPSNNMESGRYYTVDELIGRMIMHSDNDATNLLLKFVDKRTLENTYIQLGIIASNGSADLASLLDSSLPEYKFTIPQYASFFRVLYNASYLNREMSEKALSLLARSDFTAGLNAGIPSNIEVAHKWGYRELGNNGEIKQLHDCGIVYYPNHPYLLCVMTAGNSFEYLDDAIKEVSGIVYKEVDSQIGHDK